MVFTVLAAADVYGNKVNYEFDFPVQPTMSEFQARITSTFTVDASARAPAGAPTAFSIHRMQIFDDRTDMWNDLLSGAQLVDYCQVYVFQRESPWHREVQSKIPPAIRAPHSGTPPALVIDPNTAAAAANAAAANADLAVAQQAAADAAAANAAATAALGVAPLVAPPSPSAASVIMAPQLPTTAPVALPVVAPVVIPAVPDPAVCTFEHKVRVVYEVMGLAGEGRVDQAAFASTLSALRIELGDVATALFAKADANKDLLLQYQEFAKFCEAYPTVLDSLFYRHHDSLIDAAQQEAVQAAKRTVMTLRERESEARVAAVQARRESDEQDQRVRQQAVGVDACAKREADAKLVLEGAQQEVQRTAADVGTGRSEVVKAREFEAAQLNNLAVVRRDIDAAAQRLKGCESDTVRAEERMREIERLLIEQQREVDRHRELALQQRTELATLQAGELAAQESVRESEMGTRLAHETLAQLEGTLTAAQTREQECGHLLVASREELGRAVAARGAEEAELAACKEREAARATLEAEATKACDAQQEYAQALERDNLEHNVKRRQAEERERPLLDQEVRLRLQRETLEAEEARLREEHSNFHCSTGRAGIPSRTDTISPALPGAAAAAAAAA
eukprot:Rhum_TRINITY_DN13767_c5_g1::Rhum_TRINITY_DN13767_c5_g1_i1::g.64117::m.64117